MIRRTYNLVRKEFLQLARDRTMLPMIFILPIIQLMMFGYAATTDIKDIRLAVFDQDRTAFSRGLVREFTNAGYFIVSANVTSEKGLSWALDSGRASLALRLPPHLQDRVERGLPTPVQIVVDGSDSNAAGIELSYATQILSQESLKLATPKLVRLVGGKTLPGVDARTRMLYNPEAKSVNFMVPSLIAMILMIGAMSNTSQAVVRERDKGTLEQLIVTPVRRSELILGKIIPYALIGLGQITAIVLVGIFWFHVPFRGSVWLLYGSAILFLFAALGQGLFVSTISKTRQQAIMATMMFTMPAMMLSGFIFPVANMPAVAYYISFLVPMRYFLELVRAVFLKGAGINVLWPQLALLSIYAVLIFFLSVSRFQKKLGD